MFFKWKKMLLSWSYYKLSVKLAFLLGQASLIWQTSRVLNVFFSKNFFSFLNHTILKKGSLSGKTVPKVLQKCSFSNVGRRAQKVGLGLKTVYEIHPMCHIKIGETQYYIIQCYYFYNFGAMNLALRPVPLC